MEIMDKLKFYDGTLINIEDGASLGDITHIARNEADALFVCEKVTAENVKHLEFFHDLRGVAEEKGDLFLHTPENATVVMPREAEGLDILRSLLCA